ncbi:MAG: hypothetical protein RIK87_11190 [Fuerstiella sp.]
MPGLQAGHPARLFGFTFCVMSSFIICRTIADAVLLTRLGTIALPPMLFLSAAVVGSVSAWWAYKTRKLHLTAAVWVTQLSSAAVTAVLLLSLRAWPHSGIVICSLYLLAEIRGCLNAILIAVLLNENSCPSDDKGRFPLVNAAAPVAGLVMGTFVGAEAEQFEATTLLGGCIVFDMLAWIVLSRAGQPPEPEPHPNDSVSPTSSHVDAQTPDQLASEDLRTRRFVRAILCLVACKIVVLTIVGYEWKVVASEIFTNNEKRLTAYFGTFYAVADGLILAVQLLLTRHFLGRSGIVVSLLLLPLYLTALGIASLLTQYPPVLFWLLTCARGSMVIRRGIHDVALQVLYGRLPASIRRETVAWVLGVARPAAEAVAAGGIAALSLVMSPRTFTWLWLPVLLAWFWSVMRLCTLWNGFHISSSESPAADSAPAQTDRT